MVADFEKNAAAYNAICDSWAETRNKSPINRCVVQFAALLEKRLSRAGHRLRHGFSH